MQGIDFPDINRAAIIVKLKKPFIDWLIYTSNEHDGDKCMHEGDVETEGFDSKHVYLMPAYDENKDYDHFLRKHYHEIFEHELSGWYIDSSMWPQDRSWKVFQQWIDCEIQTMVFDMCEESLEYEG